MTDKSGHNDKNRSDHRNLFEQFPAGERDRFKEIWEVSARATSERPEITEDEIEDALTEVHRCLEKKNRVSKSSSLFEWRWVAAAAIILLVFGAGILLVPKTVTAPRGEITNVTLPDGSTVELNSGSKLRYTRLFSFTNRTVKLNGEAFFTVRDDDHSFIVNANGSTVKVTGTKFNIRSWSVDPGNETEVAVSEGAVQFYPAGRRDRSVTIIPGQLSRLTARMKKPIIPKPVSIDRILGWRDHKLIFNNKSLLVIFRELERRFDVSIQLENSDIGRETLTTYYAEPRAAESVLKDICRVKGLRYAETANGFRVYR